MFPEETKIEPAKLSDFEQLVQIMDQANHYAQTKSGEPMWTAMDFVHGQLRSHLEAGDCFVLRHAQKIVATITISKEDPLWGQDGTDNTALYIHKLMKDPESSIRDIGLTFLSFAAHEAIRRNRKLLRCDTKISQARLINYYHGLGFTKKRSFHYSVTGFEGVLLEADAQQVITRLA
jgi:ribosomal protein S18 acetylase RimI-like enzyme